MTFTYYVYLLPVMNKHFESNKVFNNCILQIQTRKTIITMWYSCLSRSTKAVLFLKMLEAKVFAKKLLKWLSLTFLKIE